MTPDTPLQKQKSKHCSDCDEQTGFFQTSNPSTTTVTSVNDTDNKKDSDVLMFVAFLYSTPPFTILMNFYFKGCRKAYNTLPIFSNLCAHHKRKRRKK